MNPSLIQALIEGRAKMLEVWPRADTCILAGKIALEACKYFQVKAWPMAFDLLYSNPAYIRWTIEHGGPPKNFHELPDNKDPETPWALAIADSMHVAILTDEYLIDLAADQMARPFRGMQIGPLIFRKNDADIKFWVGPHYQIQMPDGCLVAYTERPDRVGWWKNSGNWNRRDEKQRNKIVGWIVRRTRQLEDQLGHEGTDG